MVRGLDSGLSMEEIEAVLSGAGNWQPADAALLAAIDEIVVDNLISKATLERLAPHFTDSQVMDLMHLHGMYRTIACLVDTWGIELDAQVAERLPNGNSEPLFAKNVT